MMQHDLMIRTTERDGVTIITLSGKLVQATAHEFLAHVHKLVDDGVRRLVADFGSVLLTDSTGVASLISAGLTLLYSGGEPMGIASLPRRAYRLLLATRIGSFPGRMYDSVEEAVASLTSTLGTEGDQSDASSAVSDRDAPGAR